MNFYRILIPPVTASSTSKLLMYIIFNLFSLFYQLGFFEGFYFLYFIQITTLKVSGLRTNHQSTVVPFLQYFLNI